MGIIIITATTSNSLSSSWQENYVHKPCSSVYLANNRDFQLLQPSPFLMYERHCKLNVRKCKKFAVLHIVIQLSKKKESDELALL